MTEDRYPGSRWLKRWYFVADGVREGIGRFMVVGDNMDTPLGTITHSLRL